MFLIYVQTLIKIPCLNHCQAEEIYTGAVREVKEETGVRIKCSELFH